MRNPDIIKQFLDTLVIGASQTAEKLTMFPLCHKASEPRTYQVLEESISRESGFVSEVSEAGSVPTLLFDNKGSQPVLLIDGDTLTGAKQNRTLNISLLAPPQARIEIPVSCVEAGRWHRRSHHLGASPHHMYASGRARMMHDVHRSMEEGLGPRADQGEVWGDIDRKMGRMGVASPTRTMTDMFEHEGRSLEAIAEQITAAPDQVGAIFVIDDRIAGLELFDHPETLGIKLPKLVQSYALDAIDDDATPEECSIQTNEELLLVIGSARRSEDRAVGLGLHTRLQAPGLIGTALSIDGHLVRLSAFPGTHSAAAPAMPPPRGSRT